jgi:hypothetical protein
VSAATYVIFGIALSSEIALTELEPAVAATPDWSFTLAHGRPRPAAAAWFHEWRTPGGRRDAAFGRQPNAYLFRFHGIADFLADLSTRSIVCWRRRQTPFDTIRHLLLDQVIPLLMSRADARLVLHAAAVATPRGAVAFAGPTGSGKSTLATAFAAMGFPLLCDDCLVTAPSRDGFLAGSFYPGTRLHADSLRAVGLDRVPSRQVAHYTRKRRIVHARLPFLGESARLAHVFVLDGERRHGPDGFAVTPLRGREALMAVLGCTFHLDVGDRAAVRRGFELQSRFVEETPVSRLRYPWRLSGLADTRDAVLRRLEAGGS